jgi:CheY-like chemotaxis protein
MRRILVVDDDPHICLAIRAWLQRYDFRVATAGCELAASPRSTIRRST